MFELILIIILVPMWMIIRRRLKQQEIRTDFLYGEVKRIRQFLDSLNLGEKPEAAAGGEEVPDVGKPKPESAIMARPPSEPVSHEQPRKKEAAPPLMEVVPPAAGKERPEGTLSEILETGVLETATEKLTRLNKRWEPIEKQLIENWTGILGAVVVVAGVTFLSIYTALQLEPFHRFLMTVAASGVFVALYFALRNREGWQPLALWLRSIGGAVFLFACAASGGLPGLGLQWIHDPALALGLLVIGLGANLFLAFIGGTEAYGAFHVILTLIPLSIVEQSQLVLILASIVTLAGVALSFRERWDRHLLAIIAAYVAYHAAWFLRTGSPTGDTVTQLIGVSSAVAVFASAALVHYRKDYASEELQAFPLLVHITNWLLLGFALLVYTPGTHWRGVALVSSGAAAFFLARRGRSLGVRWLYLGDTLIAQSLFVAAILSFHSFVDNQLVLLVALFLEAVLFLRIIIGENEEVLSRISVYVLHAAGFLLVTGGVAELINSDLHAIRYGGWQLDLASRASQNAALLLFSALVATAAHVYLSRRKAEAMIGLECYPSSSEKAVFALGGIVGLLLAVALAYFSYEMLLETKALLFVGALILVAFYLRPPVLEIGTWLALTTAHVLSWATLMGYSREPTTHLLAQIVPLATLGALAIWRATPGDYQIELRRVAIYLLGLHVGLSIYLLFEPLSPLIPGVAWLLASLLALELSNRLDAKTAPSVLELGYLYLLAFAGAYLLVVLQTQSFLGMFRVRLLIEVFALAVIAYWWLYRPGQSLAEEPGWKRVQPWFLEIGLILLAATNLVEVDIVWRPVTWVLIALAMQIRYLTDQLDTRFRFYSLLFYWISVLDVVFIMTTVTYPSPNWYEQPSTTALIAIALQVAFIAVSHTRLLLEKVSYPGEAAKMDSLLKLIARRKALWVYYPFFIGVALFIYWQFDRSVLTLLWAAEAFGVFILSAALRENHFRYMALAGLGACLLRLILVDMAEANLGIRGVVFVGVGLLMLGMNGIYNRYRSRFSE